MEKSFQAFPKNIFFDW